MPRCGLSDLLRAPTSLFDFPADMSASRDAGSTTLARSRAIVRIGKINCSAAADVEKYLALVKDPPPIYDRVKSATTSRATRWNLETGYASCVNLPAYGTLASTENFVSAIFHVISDTNGRTAYSSLFLYVDEYMCACSVCMCICIRRSDAIFIRTT